MGLARQRPLEGPLRLLGRVRGLKAAVRAREALRPVEASRRGLAPLATLARSQPGMTPWMHATVPAVHSVVYPTGPYYRFTSKRGHMAYGKVRVRHRA